MAVDKPVPVPETEIVSLDVENLTAGLWLGGDQNGPKNSFVRSKDVELDRYGFLEPRRKLVPFLPDTVETSYQKYPALWENQNYYFTLDDSKAKFCQKGDSTWTACGGADNDFTTLNGGFPKLLRVLDNVLILNGDNGDKLAYIDLNTPGFPVVKYALVADPTTPLTGALANLSAGALNVYYAYDYSGAVGETKLSPILTKSINIPRDQWQTQTTPASIKITFADTPPAGAQFRNLYLALAATSGTIQDSDMLQLAVKLDLNTTEFIDDGSLSINLSSPPPTENTTDGPRVGDGILEDGNPILFRDKDNSYNIWIGGGGLNAMSFSVSNGGYRAEPEKGTNYYPAAIVGFRTGQGQPALTILYSNTEGLSKQAVLAQQTVNYGDQSFTVWGVTEQHYGTAGVAAPSSAINYNGKLLFLSTDGFLSAETQATIQNVLSFIPISSPIDDYVRQIQNSAMHGVIGAGWNNKYMWLVPNAGFDTPRQILVLDTNNKGVDGKGAWYAIDIPAQWIGVVSPLDEAAFVYISQGTSTYKLLKADFTFDTKAGIPVPYSTGATGALIGLGGNAHNTWQAEVQTVFYILGLIGTMTIGVRYRNQNGTLKEKTKVIHGPDYVASADGGWGDTGWSYSHGPAWSGAPMIANSARAQSSVDVREPVRVDDIHNEAQWFYYTDPGYSAYKFKAMSFEGINLGIRPDLQ